MESHVLIEPANSVVVVAVLAVVKAVAVVLRPMSKLHAIASGHNKYTNLQ